MFLQTQCPSAPSVTPRLPDAVDNAFLVGSRDG